MYGGRFTYQNGNLEKNFFERFFEKFFFDFYDHDGCQNTPLGPLITMKYQKKFEPFSDIFWRKTSTPKWAKRF